MKKFLNETMETKSINKIPMYDPISDKVYMVEFSNLYDYHFNKHFKLYKDPSLDFNLLTQTFYEKLYLNSFELGKEITNFKKPEFTSWLQGVNPYYRKDELYSLAKNLGISSVDNMSLKKLYKMVVKLSVNDNDLLDHFTHIFKLKKQNFIENYSFFDSYFINAILRKGDITNDFYNVKLYSLFKLMKKTPVISKQCIVYRFVNDVSYLENIIVGETYETNSFISCTRNPFYENESNFGNILLKFIFPPDSKNCLLFIEGYSVFPNEQEVLIAPFCEFKLISKNDDTSYYHHSDESTENIKNRYEFKFIKKNPKKYFSSKPCIDLNIVKEFDIKKIETSYEKLRKFSTEYKYFKMNNNFFYCLWFDSHCNSSYEKFFYNKISEGLVIYQIDPNSAKYLNMFEIGFDSLHVNYTSRYIRFDATEDEELFSISSDLSFIFSMNYIVIHPFYKSCIRFKTKLRNDINLYNHDLMNLLLNNKKRFEYIKHKSNFKINKDIIFNNHPFLNETFKKYNSINSFYEYICSEYPELISTVEEKILDQPILYEFEVNNELYKQNMEHTRKIRK